MSQAKVSTASWFNIVFLIGGCCIGSGMLAFPVSTAMMGFFPSIVCMLICWAFMTVTGLLILEVNLWMDEGDHMVSMASKMLGPIGKAFAWLIYLFVCYASIIAYTDAGGDIFVEVLAQDWGITMDKLTASALFVLIFGGVVYVGNLFVGRVNAILFTAMIVSYVALMSVGWEHVNSEFLFRQDWTPGLGAAAVPLLLTAFSYQYVIPSLTPMLKSHGPSLRWAIVGGTTSALVIYLLWQWLILGSVPLDSPHGLLWAATEGKVATLPFRYEVGSALVIAIAEFFTFFALVTSFLGFSLGLMDFLSDGLSIKQKGMGKIFLWVIVFLPTLFCANYFERVFYLAMETSGGFGDAILNGIMPVLMVWIGRYKRGYKSEYSLPGGRILLCLTLIFSCFVVLLELFEQLTSK